MLVFCRLDMALQKRQLMKVSYSIFNLGCKVEHITLLLQVVIKMYNNNKKVSIMANQAIKGMKKNEKFLGEPCSVGKAMGIIKGRWSFPIIRVVLMNGTLRFKELERSVANINTRMLVKELKEMEAEGLVFRKAYATVPPTVEYSLTEKGQALKPVIKEIEKWAEKFL